MAPSQATTALPMETTPLPIHPRPANTLRKIVDDDFDEMFGDITNCPADDTRFRLRAIFREGARLVDSMVSEVQGETVHLRDEGADTSGSQLGAGGGTTIVPAATVSPSRPRALAVLTPTDYASVAWVGVASTRRLGPFPLQNTITHIDQEGFTQVSRARG
jgi:hypothetical protein